MKENWLTDLAQLIDYNAVTKEEEAVLRSYMIDFVKSNVPMVNDSPAQKTMKQGKIKLFVAANKLRK